MKMVLRIFASIALAFAVLCSAFGFTQHATAFICLAILAKLDAAEA